MILDLYLKQKQQIEKFIEVFLKHCKRNCFERYNNKKIYIIDIIKKIKKIQLFHYRRTRNLSSQNPEYLKSSTHEKLKNIGNSYLFQK